MPRREGCLLMASSRSERQLAKGLASTETTSTRAAKIVWEELGILRQVTNKGTWFKRSWNIIRNIDTGGLTFLLAAEKLNCKGCAFIVIEQKTHFHLNSFRFIFSGREVKDSYKRNLIIVLAKNPMKAQWTGVEMVCKVLRYSVWKQMPITVVFIRNGYVNLTFGLCLATRPTSWKRCVFSTSSQCGKTRSNPSMFASIGPGFSR